MVPLSLISSQIYSSQKIKICFHLLLSEKVKTLDLLVVYKFIRHISFGVRFLLQTDYLLPSTDNSLAFQTSWLGL